MEVRNCRQCGCLYNYIGGAYRNLCPNCIRKLEDKFETVKAYIEDHRTATINEVSMECEVGVRQIEQWIREERLCFSDDSPIGIACEGCGKTIKTGRYCDSCKSSMINQLGNVYGTVGASEEARRKNQSGSARMRYLDK